MIKVTEAIKTINPNATYAITGSDLNTCKIEWLNGTTPISKADIEAKMAELQTAYDAKEYQRDRSVAYAEIKEQLDLLYHDMAADKGDKTGEWFKAIKAVKDANPK